MRESFLRNEKSQIKLLNGFAKQSEAEIFLNTHDLSV